MVRDVTDLVPRQTLVISQLLSGREVPVASIADKGGRMVFPLVLLDNVLPAECEYDGEVLGRGICSHLSSANLGKYVMAQL